MSFGVVQSAMTTIKNNRNLLSKRKRLKNTLAGKKSDKYEAKASNASIYQLKVLKKRLQKEHEQIRIKQFTAIIFLILILLSVFFYCY